MKIESETILLYESAEIISAFLSKPENFGKLLPPQIKNWKTEVDVCSFTIEGLTDMSLKMNEHQLGKKVSYQSLAGSKVPVTISFSLNNIAARQSEGRILIDAGINAMLALMAKRPLTNLSSLIADKLKEILNTQK